LPTPTPSQQGLVPSPTPSPSRSSTPTPTPTNSNSPSASPTPSNSTSPSSEPSENPTTPPVLPTPPTVEDPKKIIYVDPQTPTVLPPAELPSPPKGNIEIVTPPKYGTVEVTPTGEITYIPTVTETKNPQVDVVEIRYTNLSGDLVLLRKEFLLKQKGDVPRIIQTGDQPTNNGYLPSLLVITLALTLTIFRLRGGRKYE
jgi:hypothetical protein